jgi:hypothetical protein
MTVTLNLKPELEAGITAQAQARGMTVEEYRVAVVEGVLLPATQKALSARNGLRHLRRGLPAIARPFPCPNTPSAVMASMKAASTDACPR